MKFVQNFDLIKCCSVIRSEVCAQILARRRGIERQDLKWLPKIEPFTMLKRRYGSCFLGLDLSVIRSKALHSRWPTSQTRKQPAPPADHDLPSPRCSQCYYFIPDERPAADRSTCEKPGGSDSIHTVQHTDHLRSYWQLEVRFERSHRQVSSFMCLWPDSRASIAIEIGDRP